MKRGHKVTFHGAFSTKRKAVNKERKVGGFIRRKIINGHVRYVVMTGRKK